MYGRRSGRMALDHATAPPSLHGDTKGVSVFWNHAEVLTLLVRDESLCAAGKRALRQYARPIQTQHQQ